MFCCRNEKFSLHISFRHHHLTHIFISTGIEEAKEKQSQRCYGGIVIHMLTELMKGGKFNWRDFPRKKKVFSFFFLSTPSIPQIESCAMMEKNVTLMWTESRLTLLSFACYQRAALSTHPCIRAKQHRNWCRRKKMIFFMFSKKIDIWFKYLKMEWKKKSVFRLQFLSYTDTTEAQPIVLQSHKHTRNGILMCYLMCAALRGYPNAISLAESSARSFLSKLMYHCGAIKAPLMDPLRLNLNTRNYD